MTIGVETMRKALSDLRLPAGEIVIESYEAAIGDAALRATDSDPGVAHPAWFVIASLRGMGISVDQLCELAGQLPGDTLLFGSCEVVQDEPLRVGGRYVTQARIGDVGSRTTGDGSRLDHIEVIVEIAALPGSARAGEVTSRYLFKRGVAT
ncbi:hypothetical protein ND748_08965 [Frankia sp. AiPs1]|uniref:hypothetical protein n=1 Tax=Frankia sp. AiPs1 TaxID=573493 RepID=UPI002043B731|nr:hypothetical protein [Frankia sp. AiPs1]MCM3921791.1 hypothetical protein [Frankia sp. AiPs1]